MKEIFLSFDPKYFRPILYGIKKYEYRRRFPKEEVKAYLYLSRRVKEVVGIIEFGMRIELSQIINNYQGKAFERIKNQMDEGVRFAIPIKSLKLFKKPIKINEIKDICNTFHVPISYLNIQNYPKIYEMLKEREVYDAEFYHKHAYIYEDNIGKSCKEMESEEEFKIKDKLFLSNPKYNVIKCGYITK